MSIKVTRPYLSVGIITGSIDLVVILLGWAVFGTVDSVLYGLLTTACTSIVIDQMMYGSSSSKMITIITMRGQQIADAISRECERGSTMLRAVGTYTGTERQMLICVCARPQVYRIRAAAYQIDPGCMFMISDTSEVYGEGFIDPAKNQPFCDQAKAAETRASRRAAALARQLRCRLQGATIRRGCLGRMAKAGAIRSKQRQKRETTNNDGSLVQTIERGHREAAFFLEFGKRMRYNGVGDKNAGKERRESRTA